MTQLERAIKYMTDRDVKVFFVEDYKGALCWPEQRTMFVSVSDHESYYPRWVVISMMFHEYSHVWCYDNNKYKAFNSNKVMSKRYYRENALKAEKLADRMGRKFMKEVFPKMKYYAGYSYPEAKQALKERYGY